MWGTPNNRSVCDSLEQEITPLCVASPRPNVSDGGCLVDGLGGEIPVCLSPTGCHSSSHEQASVLQGLPAASDSSLLANKAVVSGPKALVNPPSVATTTSVVSAQTASVAQVSQERPVFEPTCTFWLRSPLVD